MAKLPWVTASLMGLLAKGSLQKFCGKFAEIKKKMRQERVRKFCGKLRKFAENVLQWPLPERPHEWIADQQWFQKLLGVSDALTLFLYSFRVHFRECKWWVSVPPLCPVLVKLVKGRKKSNKLNFLRLKSPRLGPYCGDFRSVWLTQRQRKIGVLKFWHTRRVNA